MSGRTSRQSSTSTIHDPIHVVLRVTPEALHRVELRAEQYGGDDPRDPPNAKEDNGLPASEELKPDPNKVVWNGPDDPENPQNWSSRRKWAITILCVLLTINV